MPISLAGIKFLNQLLVYDPEKRISITDLVNHPYLKMTKEQLVPLQESQQANGEIVSIHNQELTFNIKSSKPLEELLQKLGPQDYDELKNNPIPLDVGFVDFIDQEIKRKETTITKQLKSLINEPLEVDQNIFFRYQSDIVIAGNQNKGL